MFEKEAEEYTHNLLCGVNCILGNPRARQINSINVQDAFQDGAEFGYNKDEWHYVKDGDLPKDEDWKWCVSYRGYYYVAKYEEMFGCWTNQEYSEVMQPYAWKEIVLPELKESE